jgi:hypothetical protein
VKIEANDVGEAGAIPFLNKIQLLAEWAPLLSRLSAVNDAKTPHDRALAVVRALQWASGKSATTLDDEALLHIEAVLKTAEGAAAFDWVVSNLPQVK